MSHPSYILAAWIVSSLAIAVYCLVLVQRGRRLTRSVAPERRRWMASDVAARRSKR
jgi:heme exporter protein D